MSDNSPRTIALAQVDAMRGEERSWARPSHQLSQSEAFAPILLPFKFNADVELGPELVPGSPLPGLRWARLMI